MSLVTLIASYVKKVVQRDELHWPSESSTRLKCWLRENAPTYFVNSVFGGDPPAESWHADLQDSRMEAIAPQLVVRFLDRVGRVVGPG
jgi:hypothetical protein